MPVRRRHTPLTTLRSVCPTCGATFERTDTLAQCTECRPFRGGSTPHGRATKVDRGYGHRWQRLSKRARAAQPFCSDCGATDNLSTDHTPAAWARIDAGLPVRLQDVDVVCIACNSARGPARGPTATDRHDRPSLPGTGEMGPDQREQHPSSKAKFQTHEH